MSQSASPTLRRIGGLLSFGAVVKPGPSSQPASPTLKGTTGVLSFTAVRKSGASPAQASQFKAAVQAGDRARDRLEWGIAETFYREAIQIDPSAGGYKVQLAHCLKEQGRLLEAEIEYRSALFLGAPLPDVLEHLAFVTRLNGEDRISIDAPNDPDATPVDPAADYRFWYWMLLGHKSMDHNLLLRHLRDRSSLLNFITDIIGSEEFARANRPFLVVLNRQAETRP